MKRCRYHRGKPAGEPEVVQVARASTGAAAPSDTALEPLLSSPVTRGQLVVTSECRAARY